MNFDEYRNRYQPLYAEFAGIVRDILEKAINGAEGVPRPQSIQCRAKEASHPSLNWRLAGYWTHPPLKMKSRTSRALA